MTRYFHAHQVMLEKCRGHMACMRVCPTQAIRVRNGKASFSDELCVDCGNCIEACPEDAIALSDDNLNGLSQFKHKVIVPSPALYSQFDSHIHPYVIHLALKQLGFDEVVDVSVSAAVMARALEMHLQQYKGRLPLISSHCPCVLRLIQVKYPDLAELIVPMDVPREITARDIKQNLPAKLGIDPGDLGLFYMAVCPAKIVSITQPAEKQKSWFDGYISVREAFSILLPHVMAIHKTFNESMVPPGYTFSTDWVLAGSMTRAVKKENWLVVSGLENVMKIMDDIENSRLRNILFIEASAHMLGCVSGTFNVENAYIARANSHRLGEKYQTPVILDDEEIARKLKAGYYFMEQPILPRTTTYFDTDLETSIKRMKERERIFQKLPQINCGCCGSPTCMAFAEDFVRGQVKLTDCSPLTWAKNDEEGR